jgi:hypothetical protein
MRSWLVASLFLLLSTSLLAQPAEGDKLADVVALGSGKSISLPNGTWLVRTRKSIPGSGATYEGTLLENQDRSADVSLVVVLEGHTSTFWSNTVSGAGGFIVDQHGTSASQIPSLFSAIHVLDPGAKLPSLEVMASRLQAIVDLRRIEGIQENRILVSDVRIVGLRDALLVFTVMRLPVGQDAREVQRNFQSGVPDRTIGKLKEWNSATIASIQRSYYDKKPQQPLTSSLFDRVGNGVEEAAKAASVSAQAEIAKEQQTQLTLEIEAKERQRKTLEAEIQAQRQRDLAAQNAQAEGQERQRLAAQGKADEQARLRQEAIPPAPPAPSLTKEEQYARLLSDLEQLKAEIAQDSRRAERIPGRRALVIGNNRYRRVTPLANASEDAKALAENLSQVGYSVTLKIDLTQQEMKAALRAFKSQVGPGDEVAFVFAGHGVQIGQSNFLLPTDINGESEEQIRDDALGLDRVLEDMSEKRPKFTLVLIDACRDNPFKFAVRSVGARGLAPSNTATGQMVVFSAGAGQQALDSLGANDREKNGVFTRIFIQEMKKPGISIDRVVRNVRSRVVELAKSVGHEQVPAIYDQVVGEFYFSP